MKGITFSGSDPPGHLSEDGVSITVAGMKWLAKWDFLKLNIGDLSRKMQGILGVVPEVLIRRERVGKLS